jgi:hypothetical protein
MTYQLFSAFRELTLPRGSPFDASIIYLSVMEAQMEHLQQLQIECPFCAEMQPRETASWDENGLGYVTICQTCGKVFSGLTLISAYVERIESSSSERTEY